MSRTPQEDGTGLQRLFSLRNNLIQQMNQLSSMVNATQSQMQNVINAQAVFDQELQPLILSFQRKETPEQTSPTPAGKDAEKKDKDKVDANTPNPKKPS